MAIEIELGRENKNVNPFIEPLGEPRRGKWRRANLPLMNLADAEVAGLPDLPGYRITVDEDARRITVRDAALDDPRREEIRAKLARFFKRGVRFNKDLTFENQTAAKTLEWLCVMKRLVDGGNAELIDGPFPDYVEKQLEKERGGDIVGAGTTSG